MHWRSISSIYRICNFHSKNDEVGYIYRFNSASNFQIHWCKVMMKESAGHCVLTEECHELCNISQMSLVRRLLSLMSAQLWKQHFKPNFDPKSLSSSHSKLWSRSYTCELQLKRLPSKSATTIRFHYICSNSIGYIYRRFLFTVSRSFNQKLTIVNLVYYSCYWWHVTHNMQIYSLPAQGGQSGHLQADPHLLPGQLLL